MDPALDLDPQLLAAHPGMAIPAAAAAENPTSVLTSSHSHPPYAEMITAAIAAMNERDGSSKRAIAKYIETQYSDLPPNHSDLLTHHLKTLKTNGQLLMVKYSYQLPGHRSAPSPVNGSVNVESADPVAASGKRRRGRPSKPKPDAVQAAVPVFPPLINMNDVPVPPETQPVGNVSVLQDNAAGGPVNGTAAGVPVRGRGRPPKQGGVKRGPGRPPRSAGVASSGVVRSRGRPRKNAFSGNAAPVAAGAAVAERVKGPGRPRGRPPNPINVVEGFAPEANVGGETAAAPAGFAAPPVTGKRRGRPPKVWNEAKRPRNMSAAVPKLQRRLSGKPLGRPRKNAQATGNQTQDSQLLVAYLDLKAKLENLQSMVKQTAGFVRPFLNSEAAINAIQELELASATPTAQQPFQPQN